MRSRVSLLAAVAVILRSSSFSRSSTAAGVPAGAMRPTQPTRLMECPLSMKVGTLGRRGQRCSPATASATSLPELTCDSTKDMSAMVMAASPVCIAWMAGAPPW
ncbi:hypothetical protein D9M68_653470 [compost metagenome]